MADDRLDFCRGCGANLRPGQTQCPECGRPTGAVPNNSGAVYTQPPVQAGVPIQSSIDLAFKSVSFMLLAYIVLFMVLGLVAMFLTQVEVDYLKAFYGTEWSKILSQYGFTTDAQYINIAILNGAITVVSTLLALISFLLVYTRKHCMIAVMSCTVGALILLLSLMLVNNSSVSDILSCALQVIIGLMVARMIYRLRDAFES